MPYIGFSQNQSVAEFKRSMQTELDEAKVIRTEINIETISDPIFPCKSVNYDGVYRVTIEYEAIFYFLELFADNLIYGNGYTWEGVVIQYLEKTHQDLLSELEFDSEGDAFVAYCASEKVQNDLSEVIHELCMNEEEFRIFLQQVDHSRID